MPVWEPNPTSVKCLEEEYSIDVFDEPKMRQSIQHGGERAARELGAERRVQEVPTPTKTFQPVFLLLWIF